MFGTGSVYYAQAGYLPTGVQPGRHHADQLDKKELTDVAVSDFLLVKLIII